MALVWLKLHERIVEISPSAADCPRTTEPRSVNQIEIALVQ